MYTLGLENIIQEIGDTSKTFSTLVSKDKYGALKSFFFFIY